MKQLLLRRLHVPLVLLVFLVIAIPTSAAAPAPYVAQQFTLAMLQSRSYGALNMHRSPSTGAIDFLAGVDPHLRLAYTPPASQRSNPVAMAQGFLNEYRALFGLRDAHQ